MSKPKKLELTIVKLKEIAESINENTTANRSKSKEAKISTDMYIKQFEINRKDFSETIKDTDIKYNKSTFLYDIGEVNFSPTKVNLKGANINSEKVNFTKRVDKQEDLDEIGFKLIQGSLKEFEEDDIKGFKEGIKCLNIKETNSALGDEITSDTEILSMNRDIFNLLKSQLEEKNLQLKDNDLQIHELHKLVENSQILLKEKPQDIKLLELELEQHFQDLDDKIMNIKERSIPQQKRSRLSFELILSAIYLIICLVLCLVIFKEIT